MTPIPPARPPREPSREPLAGADATWRVGHQGRDGMFYEELRGGSWQRIELSGEMLMGRAHHVIYFASPTAWQGYPEWARARRDEIIARVKSRFSLPDYEYTGDGSSAARPTTPPPLSASPLPSGEHVQGGSPREVSPPPTGLTSPRTPGGVPAQATLRAPGHRKTQTSPRTRPAVALVFGLLLAVTATMSWLVVKGLRTGVTSLPAKHVSSQRSVSRAEDPALFWVSITLFAAVGTGTLALAAWGARQTLRPSLSSGRR